jgi:hypothetical protein
MCRFGLAAALHGEEVNLVNAVGLICRGTHRKGGCCPLAMKDAMAKALEVNDNTAQNEKRKPQQQSGDKHNQQKLQGKALQVNENSVEDQEPVGSPASPRRNESAP